jgi:chromosome segregation ATPase
MRDHVTSRETRRLPQKASAGQTAAAHESQLDALTAELQETKAELQKSEAVRRLRTKLTAEAQTQLNKLATENKRLREQSTQSQQGADSCLVRLTSGPGGAVSAKEVFMKSLA